MKPVTFLGDTKARLKAFPASARNELGVELMKVQFGEEPTDWKPMPGIGRGVREIRIKELSGAFRLVYVASIGTRIYVLHAFQKKTQKTATLDIELAKQRYKQI
jgi:phage-related protein